MSPGRPGVLVLIGTGASAERGCGCGCGGGGACTAVASEFAAAAAGALGQSSSLGLFHSTESSSPQIRTCPHLGLFVSIHKLPSNEERERERNGG